MSVIPKKLRQLRELVLGVADSLGVKLDEMSDGQDTAESYTLTVPDSIQVRTAALLASGVLTACEDICSSKVSVNITPRIWNVPRAVKDRVVEILKDYYAPSEIEEREHHGHLWDVGSDTFIDPNEAVTILRKVADECEVDANLTIVISLD